jgi:hypothetical protein
MTRGEDEENGGNADQILPKLSAHIQSALESLQNPSDCGKARLLLLKVRCLHKNASKKKCWRRSAY